MLRLSLFASLILLLVGSTEADETLNETKVSAKTEAVALFKNGYTVVRQEIDIPGSGVYRWEDVPPVIHGTFFIESDRDVEVRTTQRLVSLPVDAANPPRLAADLVGKLVTVRLSTPEGERTVSGRILDTTPTVEPNSLLPELARSVARPYFPYPTVTVPGLGTPLVLESSEGDRHFFLTGQQIMWVETEEPVKERQERRPVMLFHVAKKEGGDGSGKIQIFYLTKGTTWAPSYRIDLLDTKRLRLEQATVIRNEGLPLVDTEISLVSGFPQIECANILSPLTPSQTLEQFFRQILSQADPRRRGDSSIMSNSAMMQQAVSISATANAGFDTTALAAGEGPDIHYNSIGKRSLETGDTLSLTIGKGEADYRRVLESDLAPQILNHYFIQRNNWQAPLSDITGEVFDVLKFQNPLSWPMTTAPAMVTEKSRFLGQSQSNWVNPQQVASVKVTKVMNTSVTCFETIEEITPAVTQRFRSSNYIKRTVSQTIEIVNRRNEEVTLHLNGCFLGKIEKIESVPTKQSLSAKDFWPNELSDLFWELTLKPGESKTILISGTRWFPN